MSDNNLRVFIGGLPEKFTVEELQKLLGTANLTPNGQLQISQPAMRNGDSAKRSYTIISFDTEEEAKIAKNTLDGAWISVDNSKFELRVNYFIPSFKDKVTRSNICIRKLPESFNKERLEKAYKAFGKVLSTEVRKREAWVNSDGKEIPARCTGFVLFNEPEEANKAIEATNGKYLQKNLILVSKFINRKTRLANPTVVYINNLPKSMTSDDLAKLISSQSTDEKKIEIEYGCQITLSSCDKYEGKQWAIVNMKSNEDAKALVAALNGYNLDVINPTNGEKETVSIYAALHQSKAARRLENTQKRDQMIREFNNDRSVFIRGVSVDTDIEAFKAVINDIVGGPDQVELFEPIKSAYAKENGLSFRVRLSGNDKVNDLIAKNSELLSFKKDEKDTKELVTKFILNESKSNKIKNSKARQNEETKPAKVDKQ